MVDPSMPEPSNNSQTCDWKMAGLRSVIGHKLTQTQFSRVSTVLIQVFNSFPKFSCFPPIFPKFHAFPGSF